MSLNNGTVSLLSPVRLIGTVILFSLVSACAMCVENTVHEQAIAHADFCARYLQEGKLTEAEARCKLAIEYSPKYAEPYNLLGLVEINRGHIELAIERFKEAISLKNDFAEAYNNLGAIFLDRREYGFACDQFKEAIEIDPGYVNARVNLGLCRLYAGDAKEARNEYLKCLELNPATCDCRLGLGVLSLNAEDWREAKSHFEKMTEVCPQNPQGFYNLCYTNYKLGRCEDAVRACIGALAVKPDYIEARQNLTASYQCMALQDGALKAYLSEIQKNPGDPEPHYNLGVLYKDRNLNGAALDEFMKAIKLDGRHALAYFESATILDSMLRAPETVQMCRRFAELAQNDTQYREQKAWCDGRVKALQ
jgi:tetratricopeptide (TPR) repeat protein